MSRIILSPKNRKTKIQNNGGNTKYKLTPRYNATTHLPTPISRKRKSKAILLRLLMTLTSNHENNNSIISNQPTISMFMNSPRLNLYYHLRSWCNLVLHTPILLPKYSHTPQESSHKVCLMVHRR
jgi:hypothetical protein